MESPSEKRWQIRNPVGSPIIHVEEPTVRMTFGVNTSPFSGKEGKWGTSRKIRERLFEELRHNVSLRVEETESKGYLSLYPDEVNCILEF